MQAALCGTAPCTRPSSSIISRTAGNSPVDVHRRAPTCGLAEVEGHRRGADGFGQADNGLHLGDVVVQDDHGVFGERPASARVRIPPASFHQAALLTAHPLVGLGIGPARGYRTSA